nr:uncharacterized protein LOC123494868 [Aegilops tauschii subsp. strangulata]
MEKIDHIFVTNDWEDVYPRNLLTALDTAVSDHCPLLIDPDADFQMGRRFRFEIFWPKAEGFLDMVRTAWHSSSSQGNPFVVLDVKLRATAKALQSWSDKWIGNIRLQVLIALEVIGRLDKASDTRRLSELEHGLRKTLKKKLLGLCSLERTIARQRSRMLQLAEGEANTAFFQRHARHRQRKNVITSLQREGFLHSGQEDISEMVDDFYDELFGSASPRSASLNLDLLNLPSHDLSHLEGTFSEEEVEKIIKDMPFDKAQGPDGFTGRFYVTCWQIIKVDFMRALNQFYDGDMRGLAVINKALVSLLPKNAGASDVKDSRPVSIISGPIKIFDKILASRLAVDLPKLVGQHQSAFVRGRSLHDNFMLVQCTALRLHSLKSPSVLLKLDITKAFDTVRWPFLLEVLRRFGFGERWIAWICGLLGTSSTRIKVNGLPGRPILPCQGFRQGDPLSPMLFIICMEPLLALFQYATDKGLLAPLSRSGLRQRISMYADDVVVFFKPNEIETRTCGAILELFRGASGLLTNTSKNTLVPILCSPEEMHEVSDRMDCPTSQFPCQYLGLPLTLRKPTATQLQYLVDRVADALPLWKTSLLPKSGRLLLILSTLSAIPVHSMICRQKRSPHLQRSAGDFYGVDIKTPGEATARFLGMQFAVRSGQKTDKDKAWTEFRIKVPPEALALYQAATRTTVGNGKSTFFWEDRWLNGSRASEIASLIYNRIPARIKRSLLVSDSLLNNSWAGQIGPSLTPDALWQFLDLWQRVAEVPVIDHELDMVKWSWEKDGHYSASSAYAAGFMGLQIDPTADFTWGSKAPLQCRFFAWLAFQNRCWTSDRLIWHWMGQVTGRAEFEPLGDEDIYAWSERQNMHAQDRKATRAKCLLTMWMIWRHRNDVVFNGVSPSVALTMSRIKEEGRLWAMAGMMKRNARGFEGSGSQSLRRNSKRAANCQPRSARSVQQGEEVEDVDQFQVVKRTRRAAVAGGAESSTRILYLDALVHDFPVSNRAIQANAWDSSLIAKVIKKDSYLLLHICRIQSAQHFVVVAQLKEEYRGMEQTPLFGGLLQAEAFVASKLPITYNPQKKAKIAKVVNDLCKAVTEQVGTFIEAVAKIDDEKPDIDPYVQQTSMGNPHVTPCSKKEETGFTYTRRRRVC